MYQKLKLSSKDINHNHTCLKLTSLPLSSEALCIHKENLSSLPTRVAKAWISPYAANEISDGVPAVSFSSH